MKRPMPWRDQDDGSSSNESSSSHSDTDADKMKFKGKKSEDNFGKRKSGAVDFDALRRLGYKGGLSVLSVPPPKDDIKETLLAVNWRRTSRDQLG